MAFAPVVLGGCLVALACLGGVYLVHFAPGLSRRAGLRVVAFAGGIVLGAVFLHLLPEATELAPGRAGLVAVAAFLLLYLVESHTLPHVHGPHSGDEEAKGQHVHLGMVAVLGFAGHACFDGLALGAGYRQGSGVAETALVAVLAHKVPEGMALLTLLRHGGFDKARSLRLAWLVALMTPVVAVASWASLGAWIGPAHMGVVLAAVAGSFLYISASDLLPEVRRSPRLDESLLVVAGVAVMWAMG